MLADTTVLFCWLSCTVPPAFLADAEPGVPAAIGNGAQFSGAERLVVKRSPSLNLSKGFTFSVWLKPGQQAAEGRLLSWDDGKDAIVVAVDQSGAFARVGSALPFRPHNKLQGMRTSTPKLREMEEEEIFKLKH